MIKALALAVFVVALLLPGIVLANSDHIEYNLTVENDASANWQIIQVTNIDSPILSWEEFEEKIQSIINSAKTVTARDMGVDVSSLQMNIDLNWEKTSRTVEYVFRWENFSSQNGNLLVFGDVFTLNFFADFIGDGELYITYPQEYTITSVAPTPSNENPQTKTLHWYRTQDFTINPNIQLTNKTQDVNQIDNSIILIVGLTFASSGAVGFGFLIVNRRRRKTRLKDSPFKPDNWQEIKDSKQEVLNLLAAYGGSVKQSEICTKLKYSRAKTSILLAEMEKNQLIRRDKLGKNKIVYKVK